ncbi:MAG: hypothetical protein IH945_07700 [Armatimonadetes bacterium]|nr:hypothetical protein [Armatimonadota bacterium]
MDRSKHSRTALAGWLVAAGLLGTVVGVGFQDGKEKYGVVDIRLVIFNSKVNQEMSDRVESARRVRLSILEFMSDQQVITEDQNNRVRELELKEDKTDVEKKELEDIQQTVIAAAKEFDRLNQILSLTEPERLLLQDYHQRRDTTRAMLQAWRMELEQDFAVILKQAEQEAVDRAQAAAVTVAKREGYTVVFSSSAVIYAANDITEAATQEADK